MFSSRCKRSRSCCSVCPTCLRRMCPPARSSWLRSRLGPRIEPEPVRGAAEVEGAIPEEEEVAPFVLVVEAGGWHETRTQIASAKAMAATRIRKKIDIENMVI